MEQKLKKGDIVKIKDGLIIGKEYGGITFFPEMNFKGIRVIEEVIQYTGSLLVSVSSTAKFIYSLEMLELVEGDIEKLKFNVGDKVFIKKGLIHNERYEDILYLNSMYRSNICTINEVKYLVGRWVYTIKEDPYSPHRRYYTASMFVSPGEVKSYTMRDNYNDIRSRMFKGLITSTRYIQTDVDNTSLQLHLKKRHHMQFNFNF